jgi:hypothetical protein
MPDQPQPQWYKVTKDMGDWTTVEILQMVDVEAKGWVKFGYTCEPVVVVTLEEYDQTIMDAYDGGWKAAGGYDDIDQ